MVALTEEHPRVRRFRRHVVALTEEHPRVRRIRRHVVALTEAHPRVRWTDGWLHVGRIPGHLADLLDIEPRDGTGLILPLAVPGEPLGTPVILPPDEVGL